ncbi:hypothetical protein AB0F43_31640 [Kribbella sp. NPDC023972]|uniref:hypothetical protein n=1 Tax=Kribbella sp. NPDC023972 TaxID=3154795 RepID=UPI0033D71079
MIKRTLIALGLLFGLLVATGQHAAATTCETTDVFGNCVIEVGDPGQPGSNDPGDEGSNHQAGQCKASWNGIPIPCSIPGIGTYYAPQECYVKPAADPGGPRPGPNYKPYTCAYVTGATDMDPRVATFDDTVIWLPGDLPTITPEEAARAVAASMTFEAIKIGISQKMSGPAGVGYVGVPVWLWAKDPSGVTVGPQHVSKTYQGIGVTIDAKMTKIVWNLGDGHTTSCGPGTPYSSSYGVAESPTCGYKYTKISKSEPGGKYRITATSYWELDWAAGGQTGTIPLDFTQNTTLSVGEIQVVVSDN